MGGVIREGYLTDRHGRRITFFAYKEMLELW